MTLTVRFRRRDMQEALVLPRVTWQVRNHSWAAIGGPKAATIEASGDAGALWELIEMLRCPVEVRNPVGDAVWWGYVAEAEVTVGAITVSASLDSMANRLAVAYAYTTADNTIGTRATTAWAEDAQSIAEYGTFERLESSHTDDTTTAAALRDAMLQAYRFPIPTVRVSPGSTERKATLQCRGWWETLARRMYDNAGVDSVETTTQIEDILTQAGEFVERVDIEDASGVSSLEYRDGDTSAQAEIEKLLERGSSSGLRMLATITRERVLRVYEEPEPGQMDLLLHADGRLLDRFGVPLGYAECPAGRWARLADVIPATVATSLLADPNLLFIEEAEWDEDKGRLGRIEPRGRSVFDVSRLDPV